MLCTYKKYTLRFINPGGTSRGILYEKDTYILILKEGERNAYGECNLFKNLSCDDRPGYEDKLADICRRLPDEKENVLPELKEWPSIYFGVETVLRDRNNESRQIIFSESISSNGFSIPINGLIWMSDKKTMKEQIVNKLKDGYRSIKLKIGAIDFESELGLLKFIRKQFRENEVELRVDANGAFHYEEAKEKIKRLSDYQINYIEQPIKPGRWQEMAALAENAPVKIALDEELTGITSIRGKKRLIDMIAPQILILKPALLGGFSSCDEWKKLIEKRGGAWVITSALESNIGLNAIAQYAAVDKGMMAQGLGTGQLFENNFPSPYTVDSNGLHYHCDKNWDFSLLK